MELDEDIVAKMNIEKNNYNELINYIECIRFNLKEKDATIVLDLMQLVRDYEYELYNLKLQISDLKSFYRKLKISPLTLDYDYCYFQLFKEKITSYYMELLRKIRDYIIEEKVKADEEKEGEDIELQ